MLPTHVASHPLAYTQSLKCRLMDNSSGQKVIATCRGSDRDNPREIDGDRANFRFVKELFIDAVEFVEHAGAVRSGDQTRPASSATGPPTRAQWDSTNKWIYTCTRLLLSEELREYHQPTQDSRVKKHDGASLWEALEEDFGDSALTAKDSSTMLARIVGVKTLKDGGIPPSAAVRVVVNANSRLPGANKQSADNMRTIVYRMLPPCLSTKVDVWEERDPPTALHTLVVEIRQAESKFAWDRDKVVDIDTVSPLEAPGEKPFAFLSQHQSASVRGSSTWTCSVCKEDCPRDRCKMRICRHCKKRTHWSDECYFMYGSNGKTPTKKAGQLMIASGGSMQDKIDAAVTKAMSARAPDLDIDAMACAAVGKHLMIAQPEAPPPDDLQEDWRAQMDAAFMLD